MGIKIVSDGPQGHKVKVTDAETGEPISGITSLRVRILPGQKTEAYMTVIVDKMDIDVEEVKEVPGDG